MAGRACPLDNARWFEKQTDGISVPDGVTPNKDSKASPRKGRPCHCL